MIDCSFKENVLQEIILATNFIALKPFYSYSSIDKNIIKVPDHHMHKKVRTDWAVNHRVLRYYNFWLPFKGKGKLKINDEEYNIDSQTLFIMKPKYVIEASSELLQNLHVFSIYFEVPENSKLFDYIDFPISTPTSDNYFQEQFIELFKREKDRDHILLHRRIFIYNVLQRLAKNNLISLEKVFFLNQNKYFKYQELISFIKENITEKLTLKDLEDFSIMDKTSIITMFSKYNELTPMRYINKTKIDYCKNDLISGNSIKATAYKYNFPDVYSFSKIFKKFEGISPGHFIKNYQSDFQ